MKRKYVFAPYLCDGNMKNVRIQDIEKATHINYAFGLLVDGKVDVSHLKNLETLMKFKMINPELKVILSVGGWGAGGFSNASATKEGRELFAKTAAEIVEKYNFDGIDIDWEYPSSDQAGIDYSPEDKYTFTYLLEELRNTLDALGEKVGRQMLLTCAVGAESYFIEGTEMDKAVKYLDYVNLMTYDMRGGFTDIAGHHTNLYYQNGDVNSGPAAERTVKIFNEAGVPIEKMVLGAAFYARAWKGIECQDNHGLGQKAKTIGGGFADYDKLKEEYIDKNGYVRYWDDAAKAPWLFNGDTFVSYDDPESLKEKCKYVMEKGLAGMMYWCYSSNELFDVIDENLE